MDITKEQQQNLKTADSQYIISIEFTRSSNNIMYNTSKLSLNSRIDFLTFDDYKILIFHTVSGDMNS